MKDILIQRVSNFLRKHLPPHPNVLVGYSGGTDSLALFHLLLECKKNFPLELHLAHIDHGWRSESSAQAHALQEDAQNKNISFHLHTLSKETFINGNLEDVARRERYRYFQRVYKEIKADVLLIAHQKEDLAETVLKRLLEGAHFFQMVGMQPVTQFEGMQVGRPLLSTSKKQLSAWLHERGLIPIEDETNLDQKYLRARMRESFIPHLETLFGKNILDNICSLSQDLLGMKTYFEKRFARYEEKIQRGPFGKMLDLHEVPDVDPFELSCFIKHYLFKDGHFASKEVISQISSTLLSKAAGHKYPLKGKMLYVDRGVLFLCEPDLPAFDFTGVKIPFVLENKGWTCIGEWSDEVFCNFSNSWKNAFLGEIKVVLPKREYKLVSNYALLNETEKNILRNKQASYKAPNFLKGIFPFVLENDKVIHDFLSGSVMQNSSQTIRKGLSLRLFRTEKAKTIN